LIGNSKGCASWSLGSAAEASGNPRRCLDGVAGTRRTAPTSVIEWSAVLGVLASLFRDVPIHACSLTTNNYRQKSSLGLIKELARTRTVKLMYHRAEDQKQCHRHIVRTRILNSQV